MNTTQTQKPILLHVYFDTKEEAVSESFQTGLPWFRSHKNGREYYSVRVKVNR